MRPASRCVPQQEPSPRPGRIERLAPQDRAADDAGQRAARRRVYRGCGGAAGPGRRRRSRPGRRRRSPRPGRGAIRPLPAGRRAARALPPSRPPRRPARSPRLRAPVQTSGRVNCSDDTPPQAAAKSPPPTGLHVRRAGRVVRDDQVEGPRPQAAQSSSRLAASRIGGEHLQIVVAVPDVLRAQRQVVRAGLRGQPARPRGGPTRSSAARRSWTDGRCARARRSAGPPR